MKNSIHTLIELTLLTDKQQVVSELKALLHKHTPDIDLELFINKKERYIASQLAKYHTLIGKAVIINIPRIANSGTITHILHFALNDVHVRVRLTNDDIIAAKLTSLTERKISDTSFNTESVNQ